MKERQPYLPKFSPKESAPYKGAEHLVVEKLAGDYFIYLTQEGARKICRTQYEHSLDYPYFIDAQVVTEDETQEFLQLKTTRDRLILNDKDSHDKVLLTRDERGPIVIVATWLIGQLLTGERDYVVARYHDGQANKIWIRMKETETQVQAA